MRRSCDCDKHCLEGRSVSRTARRALSLQGEREGVSFAPAALAADCALEIITLANQYHQLSTYFYLHI
jgi:hypothetical protein